MEQIKPIEPIAYTTTQEVNKAIKAKENDFEQKQKLLKEAEKKHWEQLINQPQKAYTVPDEVGQKLDVKG